MNQRALATAGWTKNPQQVCLSGGSGSVARVPVGQSRCILAQADQCSAMTDSIGQAFLQARQDQRFLLCCQSQAGIDRRQDPDGKAGLSGLDRSQYPLQKLQWERGLHLNGLSTSQLARNSSQIA